MKKIYIRTIFYSLFLNLISSQAMSHEMNIEIGRTKTTHNYFQLPNEDVNRVNLPDDKYLTSHRINAKIDLNNKSFLYLLYAPLESEYNFKSSSNFEFNDSNFSANTDTNVSYKFNSYRVGYFRKFNHNENFKYWLGGVIKIRDAKIRISQGNNTNSYSNVGLVPLIGVGGEYYLNNQFSILSHIETLGFSQGYAYDFNSEIKYHLNQNNKIGFGYRTFGGGVDNDKLMNFARFESFYISYQKNFGKNH